MTNLFIKRAISIVAVASGLYLLPNHYHSFDSLSSAILTLFSALLIVGGGCYWPKRSTSDTAQSRDQQDRS